MAQLCMIKIFYVHIWHLLSIIWRNISSSRIYIEPCDVIAILVVHYNDCGILINFILIIYFVPHVTKHGFMDEWFDNLEDFLIDLILVKLR